MIKAMITAISQNQNEDRSLGKILYVTHSRYEGDWHSTPHSHACAELFYVISGEGKFFVEVGEPLTQNELLAMGDLRQQASEMRKRYKKKYEDIANKMERWQSIRLLLLAAD